MKWLLVVVVLVIASLASQPPHGTSGPLLAGAQIDPAVLAIFQRACADCHSGNTHFPWYSYVAPVSFLVRDDVLRGREHLDLSRWNEYPLVRKERSLSEIANQVRDGDMPLPQYTWIHRTAKLSTSDVDGVFRWTQTERARLIEGKR